MKITCENSLYYNFYGYPVLPASFFIKKSYGAPEFHWDSNMDSHLVRLYLVLSQQKVQKWKAKTILINFHLYFIFIAWILFKI